MKKYYVQPFILETRSLEFKKFQILSNFLLSLLYENIAQVGKLCRNEDILAALFSKGKRTFVV